MQKVSLISPAELHRKMNEEPEVVILDVRNEEDFKEWKIEGKNLRTIHVPYFQFLEEDEGFYEQLPKDREMVVVCGKGGASEFVAETLQEKGYSASSLVGGMLSWSQYYHPKVVFEDDRLKIIQINRLAKGCLSYAVVSRGKGMILDPSHKLEVYLDLAKEHQFQIAHVVDSHLHADHISGGMALAREVGATYYIAAGEAKGTNLQFEPLDKHERIRVGDVDVEILAIPTPGHTPGSTSFLIDKRFLLSGDTIFVSGLGRPDLGGKAQEWAKDLYDTVFNKLNHLPDECLVLPGHYGEVEEINEEGIVGALLGDIRNSSELMQLANKEAFTEQVLSTASSEKPPNFEDIIAINRGEKKVTPEEAVELELGPNRCAMHHLG